MVSLSPDPLPLTPLPGTLLNRKDAENFLSGFTDQGLPNSVLSLPESIGVPPIGLRRVMEVEVTGDEAHIHVMFGLGTHRQSLRHSLIKIGDGWKINGEERLPPKIKGATIAVDTRIVGCSLEAGDSALTTGNVDSLVKTRFEEAPAI